ncbi:helix-turn-helix domain-containing protein [Planctomyces sp. SH-PL14]|uniref:helix-turn-helix domain-containing protein n=1 Tax=Planctomyces sp. SH-PL14 TaxID=1632864 RepID=UPI00078E007A|nr:helix-turn-helix domain-containing protein [Planctomyces sp. SH-PL14]AMV20681.1 Bacterial regulatory protein, Fis family [Planctomyces sp. SH-PL14]
MSGGHRQFTDEEILDALAACQGLISRAARRLGCTPRAIYYRRAKNPEIDRAILEARSQLIDDAEEGLRHHLEQQAPWAIAFVLKTLGKNRGYVERVETREVSDETLLLALEREREIERVRRLEQG